MMVKKGEDVITGNIISARAGHDHAVMNCKSCSFHVAASDSPPLLLIAGNEAIGLGAIASAVKFYSAYPMTPSTGIMNYIAGKGCNTFSFLPYNAGGDGDDVWPFVQRDDKYHYDCSKLDQWGIVFSTLIQGTLDISQAGYPGRQS